jgi:PAS domain-containing protein
MLRHDHRVTLAALAGGALGVVATWWFAARVGGDAADYAVAAVVTGAWLVGAAAVRAHVERPLQTLANMLAALREGDFSTRGRAARPDDALGLAFVEANLLTATLREERLRSLESAALLRRVLAEIDAAIFAFDEQGRLRLVNRAGERLLARPAGRALGETATALGLAELGLGDFASDGDGAHADGAHADGAHAAALVDAAGTAPGVAGPRVVPATFPGGGGRWEVRAGVFRQDGRPHRLLVVTDLSETLRAEERLAWQRLIRVLSHEINNSLAPIKTIAGSLRRRALRASPWWAHRGPRRPIRPMGMGWRRSSAGSARSPSVPTRWRASSGPTRACRGCPPRRCARWTWARGSSVWWRSSRASPSRCSAARRPASRRIPTSSSSCSSTSSATPPTRRSRRAARPVSWPWRGPPRPGGCA